MRGYIKKLIMAATLSVAFFAASNVSDSASAQDMSRGFEYAVAGSHGEVRITGYYGTEDSVAVPEYLAGQRVVEIGSKAFSGNGRILSCDLSQCSIEKISDMAFSDCVALKQITLPPGLKAIGDSAFSGCAALEKIDFPFFMEEIGEYAFYECATLSELTQEGAYFKGIGAFAFYGTGISSFAVPYRCQVGSSAFPRGTSVYTSKNDESLPNLKDCVIHDISDFDTSTDVKKNVIVGQRIVLSAELKPGTWCAWEKQGTGKILSKSSTCSVTASAGSTVYACHVTNGVYSHDVLCTVIGNATGEGILAKVTGLSATEKNDCVILKWKRTADADGYMIYRSAKPGSGYKEIGTTQSVKYTDRSGKRGKTYYYKVCTYKMVSGRRACGQKSTYKKYKLLGIPTTPRLKINRKRYIIWSRKKGSGVVIYVKRQGVWIRAKRLAFSKYRQNSIRISAKSVTAAKIRLYYQGKGYRAGSKFSNVVRLKK